MLIACLMVFQVVGMLTYHLQSLPTIIALRPVLVWLPLVSHELHPSLGWAWERLFKNSFLSLIKEWVSHTRKQGTSLVREVTPCRCESYDSSFFWILKRLLKSLSIYIILPAIPLLTKRWFKLSVEWDIQEENLLESRPLKGCNQIPYRKKVIFVPDSLKRSLLESPQTALSYLFVLRMLLSTIEVRLRNKLFFIKKYFMNGWERTWVVESMRGMSPMPEVPHHQSNEGFCNCTNASPGAR